MEKLITFLAKLTPITTLLGVEVFVMPDGTREYSGVILKKKKDKLKTVQTLTPTASFKELISSIKGVKPIVSLCISGKGIITRKLDMPLHDKSKALQLVLPGAKNEDFIVIEETINGASFVSAVRSSVVHEIAQEIKEEKLNILDLHLSGIISDYLYLVSNKKLPATFARHSLHREFDKLDAYTTQDSFQETSITLEEEILDAANFVAYSAALKSFLLSSNTIVNDWSTQRDETIHKHLFFSIGKVVGAIFLLLLLFNFAALLQLREKNAALIDEASEFKVLLDIKNTLQQRVTEKKTYLSKTGWLTSSRFSFYADRLGSTVTPEITLHKELIFPIDQRISKEEQRSVFQNNLIEVEGECHDPTAMNKWVRLLEKEEWVSSVSIKSYEYDNKNQVGEFIVSIIVL